MKKLANFYLLIGIGTSISFGIAFHNMLVGMCIGIAIGVSLGNYNISEKNRKI